MLIECAMKQRIELRFEHVYEITRLKVLTVSCLGL
jgi:hypothetical protein